MAKTYQELAAVLLSRNQRMASGMASSAIDAVAYAPARAAEAVHHAKEAMKTKAEVVATTIEAKLLLEDHLLEQIDKTEFALRLAEDENLRKTMNQLAQQILQPTPLSVNPSMKSNSFIDIGAGISAFWNEMQQKLPVELEDAAEIENVLMNINAGLDRKLEPDTRKLFLKEAGIPSQDLSVFVPVSDYAEYEDRMKEGVRQDVLKDLGMEGRELTEEEQLLVESMVDDRMLSGPDVPGTDGAPEDYLPTYEDTYGVSVQDLYEMFGSTPDGSPLPEPGSWEDAPVGDPDWENVLGLSGADEAYWDMMNATVDGNMELLRELESQEHAMDTGIGLTDADLAFADAPPMDFGISDEDLAFAAQYAESYENGY